jgi:hypothetical protein
MMNLRLSALGLLGLAAVALGQGCCPNGVYTDDPKLICSKPNTYAYGDGQCYGQYEIDCFTSPDSPTYIGFNDDLPDDASIVDCFNFCREFEPSFTTVSFTPFGYAPPNCDCIINAGTLDFDITTSTLNYCGSGPPPPPLPCCQPFLGDETKICMDPTDSLNYGDRQCLPNKWMV